MKTYVQEGDALEFTAPSGGVVAGNGYLIGSIFGVARTTAAEGAAFILDTGGVYTLPKKAGDTPAQGAVVYWDDTNKYVTTTASGNTKIGAHAAAAAAASAAATLPVRLNESV